jgi:hypothetical protein
MSKPGGVGNTCLPAAAVRQKITSMKNFCDTYKQKSQKITSMPVSWLRNPLF